MFSHLYSFIWIHTFIWHHFSSAWRTSFSISYRVGLLMMKSFSFYVSKIILILSVFKWHLYWICNSRLTFFLHCFKDVAPLSSLLHYFWQEVCCHLFPLYLIYKVCFFSLAAPKIFCLSLFNSLIMMCLCMVFFMILRFAICCFLNLWMLIFHEIH